MSGDLAELLERVDLCQMRSQQIEANIDKLASTSIAHWTSNWQPHVGQITAKLLRHPSVAIRQEVGMLVNELRSILDALACKLATRNGANNTNSVYFPIMKNKAGFYDGLGRGKIKRLSNADQQAIEDLKPWNPTDDDPEDGNRILFQLHEADRVRKHQDLLRWACLGGARPAEWGTGGNLQINRVVFSEVGKEMTLANFFGVSVPLYVSFDVIYLTPDALGGYSIAPLLSEFNDAVRRVVTGFF